MILLSLIRYLCSTQARRFITMTDELNETKCALACNSITMISLLDVNEIENKNADSARNEEEETGGVELEGREIFGNCEIIQHLVCQYCKDVT